MTISCTEDNKTRLEALAVEFDCKRGDKPNLSSLFAAIAIGKIQLICPSRQAVARAKIAELKEEIKALEKIK